MLRHIISVSLAMTACATFIPTKVNAATLTIRPTSAFTIPSRPGDIVEYLLFLNPTPSETVIAESLSVNFDETGEFSSWFPVIPFAERSIVSGPRSTLIASFKAVVGTPVRDGIPDLVARLTYLDPLFGTEPFTATAAGADVVPVPEPLTIFGTATALGCGVLFKRKSYKKTVS